MKLRYLMIVVCIGIIDLSTGCKKVTVDERNQRLSNQAPYVYSFGTWTVLEIKDVDGCNSKLLVVRHDDGPEHKLVVSNDASIALGDRVDVYYIEYQSSSTGVVGRAIIAERHESVRSDSSIAE